jgi:endogenous inhibitor of DNA gyrase (YacG/DUF329 family)
MGCPICGKETNDRNYAKIGKDLIYFCSGQCAFEFMKKKYLEEGKVIAIKISEE